MGHGLTDEVINVTVLMGVVTMMLALLWPGVQITLIVEY